MVCVFARKTSEPLTSLVKQIDEQIAKHNGLKSFVVITPKKGEQPADALKTLAKDAGITHVPLTVGESPDGPPDYEVAKDADVTVLMWKRHKVRVNHAYKGALTADDIRTIVDDIPKLLAN